MRIPSLIDPSIANRLKNRFHRKYDKRISKDNSDEESMKTVGYLKGFRGSVETILAFRTDSNQSQAIPYIEDPINGGIIVRPGVDLGHNEKLIFSKVLQPNLNLNQRRILYTAIGLKGQDASDFLNENLSNLGPLETLESARYKKAISIAINVYWTNLVEDHPWLIETRIRPDYHTILVSYVLDHGLNNVSKINHLVDLIYSNQMCLLANWLYDESNGDDYPETYSKRRGLEGAYLLREIFPLTKAVGPGCINEPNDVKLISNRLMQLGFIDDNIQTVEYSYDLSERLSANGELCGFELRINNNINLPEIKQIFALNQALKSEIIPSAKELMANQGGQGFNSIHYPKQGDRVFSSSSNELGLLNDFSPLIKFQNVVNSCKGSDGIVNPGDTTHMWLCSDIAPNWISTPTNLIGIENIISVTSQTQLINNWLLSSISSSGLRFAKLQSHDQINNGSIRNHVFNVIDYDAEESYFKLAIPSLSDNITAASSLDIDYDRESMRGLLQSIITDEMISGPESIHLNDPVLAAEGLCTLKPQQNSTQGISSSDYVLIKITCPKFFKLAHLNSDGNLLEHEVLSSGDADLENGIMPLSNNMIELLENYIDELSERIIHLDDYDKRAQYYYNVMINSIANEYLREDGTLLSPAILNPLDVNKPYLLGIKNWKKNCLITPSKNSYDDALFLIWNDGLKLQIKEFEITTVPKISFGFRNLKGDLHLASGRYLFELKIDGNDVHLQQSEHVTIGRDSNKSGSIDENSSLETGDFGLIIGPGNTESKLSRKARGSQLFRGDDAPGSSYDEFTNFLTSVLGIVSGDEILYTLIHGEDALSSVDVDLLFGELNSNTQLQQLEISYVITGSEIFDQNGVKLGVDVEVTNNVGWPPIFKHFDSNTTVSEGENKISAKLNGNSPEVTGLYCNGYFYPKSGTIVNTRGV